MKRARVIVPAIAVTAALGATWSAERDLSGRANASEISPIGGGGP